MTIDSTNAHRFEDLDSDGKIRQLDAELSFVKSELEEHRAILVQLLLGFAAIGERFPGAATDIGAELRARAFDLSRREDPEGADFRRGMR
jgi:hypothetical protein